MKFLNYWKVILFALFIFFGSVTSNSELNKVPMFKFEHSDKLIHFLLYFVLSILVLTALYKNSKLFLKEVKILTVIFVVSYGILMEVFQFYFTFDRTADIFDVLANTTGCLSGILIFNMIKKSFFYRYL